jgi:tetratricopeptide (TPR) repeat protein
VPRPGELDAQVFAELVTEARDLARRGASAAAAARLRSALQLWRGPALLGLSGRAVEAVAVRLAEQRLIAAEDCFELELGLGRHRDLVGELAELVAANPLRERLVGHLMRALHGSGRQPEALAAYGRLRAQLTDVLAAARYELGATGEAASLGQAALALARELGERRIEAEVLNTLGVLAHRTGRHRDAVEHHEQALHLTRATGDRYPEAEALIGLATEHRCLGIETRLSATRGAPWRSPARPTTGCSRSRPAPSLAGRRLLFLACADPPVGDSRKPGDGRARKLARCL